MEESNSKNYSNGTVDYKVTEFTNLRQGTMLVLEYVRQFDPLSRYALDMVALQASKIRRILMGVGPGLTAMIDTGSDKLKSYVDAVKV